MAVPIRVKEEMQDQPSPCPGHFLLAKKGKSGPTTNLALAGRMFRMTDIRISPQLQS